MCSDELKSRRKNGVFKIPNGVDTSEFKPLNFKRTGDVVFVSSFEKNSVNIKRLSKIINELAVKNISVTIVGSGPEINKLRFLADRRINFTGKIKKSMLPCELNRHKVGILPLDKSRIDKSRFPVKMLEYASCGLAVVADNVGEAGIIF